MNNEKEINQLKKDAAIENNKYRQNVNKKCYLYPVLIGVGIALITSLLLLLFNFKNPLTLFGVPLLFAAAPIVPAAILIGEYMNRQNDKLDKIWVKKFTLKQRKLMQETKIFKKYMVTRRHVLLGVIASIVFAFSLGALCG